MESGKGYYVVQFLSAHATDYNTVTSGISSSRPFWTRIPARQPRNSWPRQRAARRRSWPPGRSGEKTADAFSALALEHSDDEDTKDGGGLLEQVYKGDTANDLTDWIFADGRAVGDWALLQSNDGYHIMYVDSFGVPYWKLEVKSTLRQAAYNAWIEELREKYPLGEEGFGMKFVG